MNKKQKIRHAVNKMIELNIIFRTADNIHFIIETDKNGYDFWPSTGNWCYRDGGNIVGMKRSSRSGNSLNDLIVEVQHYFKSNAIAAFCDHEKQTADSQDLFKTQPSPPKPPNNLSDFPWTHIFAEPLYNLEAPPW